MVEDNNIEKSNNEQDIEMENIAKFRRKKKKKWIVLSNLYLNSNYKEKNFHK